VKKQLVSSSDQNRSPSVSTTYRKSARCLKFSSGVAEYSCVLGVMQFYTVSIGTYTPVGMVISDFKFLLRCEGDLRHSGLVRCLDW